jgi:hypothetical protein
MEKANSKISPWTIFNRNKYHMDLNPFSELKKKIDVFE